MSLKVADRVKETTTTTGTGTISLAGADTGFQTFVVGVGTGNVTYYALADQDGIAWEVGYGTVTDGSPDTLSRTPIASSSGGSAISLGSGTHTVFATYPAGRSLVLDTDGTATTARAALGVDAAGTDNSTPVTLAGTPDYITLSGQEITRNQIDLTADITGTLPVANGGIGTTSLDSLLQLNQLTDVKHGGSNFTYSILIGNNGPGVAPTSGTLASTCQGNLGIGYLTLKSLSSGDYNVAIGYNAGNAIEGGYGNILVGSPNVGSSITSGKYNIALGTSAMHYGDDGDDNIAIGRSALKGLTLTKTTGNDNIGIGYSALQNITSGINNVAIGHKAGQDMTGSDDNQLFVANNTIAADGTLIRGDFAHKMVAVGNADDNFSTSSGAATLQVYTVATDDVGLNIKMAVSTTASAILVEASDGTDKFVVSKEGAITTGSYTGTAIADSYISSASTWDAKGDMTGVNLTGGTGISIDSEVNTTSGDYSSTITCTLTDTTYLGGTNLSLVGTTFNVDDSFLKNDADDETSGTITAGGFTTAGTLTVDTIAISTIQASSESFADNDTSLMTSKSIKSKIESYGYSTGGGTASDFTVTANNTADETVYPVFVDGATGTQGAETDTGLTYNPSSGVLTSTAFAGNVTGDVSGSSGSCTGNAATVTTNANLTGHITSTGNATVLGEFTISQLSAALSDASISGTNTGDQTSVSGSSGSCTGNAATSTTATRLATPRTIGMSGDVSWTSASFDGSGSVTGTATIQSGAVDSAEIVAGAIDEAHLNATNDPTDDYVLSYAAGGPGFTWVEMAGGGGGGEANEDSFKTISVSGQTDVVADTTTDTLTLAEGSNVTITTSADTITIAATDTNTTYTGGTNLTLAGTTFNVDDAFLKNDASDTTTGTITAGGFTTTGTWTFDESTSSTVGITTVQKAASSFSDNDTSLMTSAAIADKIEAYGYTTNTGDMTGVDLTAGTGITIDSETNTASGDYSATITCTVTDTNTTYTGGTNLTLAGTTFNVDDAFLINSGDDTTTGTITAQGFKNTGQNAVEINPHGTSAGNTGEIRLLELAANGTNYVGFKAPDAIGGSDSQIYVLPAADGSNGYQLTTDGSGNLSWAAAGGGGGGEANEDSFKTISVSGQTDVVADTTTDTLTLAEGSNVTITTSADTITIAATDTNTTYTGGTNLTLAGTTFNVDDAFLKNDASDTTTGTITAGGFTTTGTWTFDEFTSGTIGITTVQDSGTTFDDNDTSLMTAASIADKIEAYGYTTNAGDMTGVDLTAGTGISIDSETNTTSGDYSATITCTVTDTNTTYTGGTNLTLAGTTFNVDDAFLVNDADDTTTGTITAGGFTTTGTWTFDESTSSTVGITTVQKAASSFSDNDTSLMTSAAIADKIEAYGYTTNAGDMTGVDLTAGTGITIDSETNTASGDYSATITCTVTDTNTTYTGGTNLTLAGTTFNVDDAFLKNDASDTTTGTITAGGFTTTGTWTFDEFTSGTIGITTVQDSGTTFDDNDTSLMTAAAIADKIEAYGYSTTAGDITGVTAGTGLTGGGSSGAVTLTVDITGTADLASPAVGDELLISDADDSNTVKKADLASIVNLADHDALTNFVANEHLDWTTNVGTIHAGNYTNTTYSVGDGGLTQNNFTNTLKTKLDGIEASATADQTAGEILTLLEDGIDSVHYKDGSIDNAHIADDAIDSEHYAAGSIDTAHIADDQVTLAKMAGLVRGKIIYGDASGNPAALAISSTDGHVLKSDGTDISWGAVTATVSGNVFATDLKVGRDAHNLIDFTTDDNIVFRAGNEDQLTLVDGALTPSSNAIVDLGTDALEFKDGYFDGTLEADAITIGGTAIGSIYSAIAGSSSILTTGALDSGSITSGFGNIDNGGSSIACGSLDVSDGAITNVGDIDCDSISIADAAVGLDIVFGGNTTLNKMTLTDNLADALNVTEGSNSYIKICTTNATGSTADAEKVHFGQAIVGATNTATDGGAVNIDCSKGNYHEILMNATATSIVFENASAGQRIVVRFKQHSSHIDLDSNDGWDTVTINGSSATVTWPGGTVPTLTETNNAIDVYGFIFQSTVTNVHAFVIGQNLS